MAMRQKMDSYWFGRVIGQITICMRGAVSHLVCAVGSESRSAVLESKAARRRTRNACHCGVDLNANQRAFDVVDGNHQ